MAANHQNYRLFGVKTSYNKYDIEPEKQLMLATLYYVNKNGEELTFKLKCESHNKLRIM